VEFDVLRDENQIVTSSLVPAVGYVRCSTENQEDSPDQQKKEIIAFADKKGYEIVEWFVDFGKSGTTFDQRPEFQRLRSAVDHGPTFRAVICYDESRWGRAIDSNENTYWRVYFDKRRVKLLLVKTAIDPMHEYAPMMQSFEGIMASQFSKKLSDVTLRGAKNNGKYSNGGTAPYGYQRVAVNLKSGDRRMLGPGEWCIKSQEKVEWALGSQNEIDVVKYIFRRRLEGHGYVSIAHDLNTQGVPCSQRGRWRNLDQNWSSGTIKSIVENESYMGNRVYNKNTMSKIRARQDERYLNQGVRYPHWRNHRDEWVREENAHPAIITKETWSEANTVNRDKRVKGFTGSAIRSTYLLTGLMRCSRCGFAFQGCSTRAKGKVYRKYVDGGRHSKGICSHLGIKSEILEAFAIQAIKDTLADPSLLQKIEECLGQLLRSSPDSISKRKVELISALTEKRFKIKNLTEELAMGNRSEAIREKLAQLEQEEAIIQGEIASQKSEPSQPIAVADISRAVSEFILNFENEFEKAPIEEKKLLVRKCISQIIVDREKSVVRFYVRKVPAATPWLEEALKEDNRTTGVVRSSSSGDRT
jgi:site-specific DNA recombinase